eukprot:797268-Rhodomonas_salina.1
MNPGTAGAGAGAGAGAPRAQAGHARGPMQATGVRVRGLRGVANCAFVTVGCNCRWQLPAAPTVWLFQISATPVVQVTVGAVAARV